MSTSELLRAFSTVALALAAGAALGSGPNSGPITSPNLGKPVTDSDLAAWDISAQPDGTGLPPGSGTPAQGEKIYAQKCAACHGESGKGGIAAAVIGGKPVSEGIDSVKTVANFWGYATPLFDFIRRAMPYQQPRSLTDDEAYALTAYILSINKIIGEKDTMNAQTLPKVRMPNRDNFIIRFPEKI